MSNKSNSPKTGRKQQIKVGSTLDTLQREEGRVTFMENIRANGKVYLLAFTVIMAIAIFGGLGIGQFNNSYGVDSNTYRDSGGNKVVRKNEGNEFFKLLVIAKCEGESILRSDFDNVFKQVEANAQNQDGGTVEPIKWLQLRDVNLRDNIEQIVLRKYAKDKKIKVDEAKVKELLNMTKKQFSQQAKKEDKKVESIVGALKSKLAPQENYQAWYDYLKSRNITEEGFIKDVRKAQLAQQAKEDMKKTADDKQFKDLMPKAEKIYKEIKDGKITWEAAVAKYSDADKSEKEKQGALIEPIWKTMRSHEWVDKVFAKDVKPGQILPPMRSDDPSDTGVEIIKFVGAAVPTAGELKDEAFKMQWLERYKTWWKDDPTKAKKDKLTDEEMKDVTTKAKVQRIILKVKEQGEVEKQINGLIENSKIEIYDPLILAFRAYDGAAERTEEAIKAGKDHLTEKEMTETRFVMRPGEQMSIFVYQSGKRRFEDAIKYARIVQSKNPNNYEVWMGYYLEAMFYREWFKAPDATSKPTEKIEDVYKKCDNSIVECLKFVGAPNPWVFLEQAYAKFDLGDRKAVEDAISDVLKYGGHQPVLLEKVKKFYKEQVKDMKRYAEIDLIGKKPATQTQPNKPSSIEIPEDVSKSFDADLGKDGATEKPKAQPAEDAAKSDKKSEETPKPESKTTTNPETKEPANKDTKSTTKPETKK